MTNPTKPTTQQTLQQQRAKSAWEDTGQVKTNEQSEYKSLVRGFAAQIQRDGLGASLVFLKAKGKSHHLQLEAHVNAWVLTQLDPKASNPKEFEAILAKNKKDKGADLLKWLLNKDSNTYRRAAAEAIAYLMWLKRFVEAWKDTKNG
ncbi:MAG: hypothetical protein OHK0023_11980 [Anaerolineae bacterium]